MLDLGAYMNKFCKPDVPGLLLFKHMLGHYLMSTINNERLKVANMLEQNITDMLNNMRFLLTLQQCLTQTNINIVNVSNIPKHFLYKELATFFWYNIGCDEWLNPKLEIVGQNISRLSQLVSVSIMN